MPLEQTATWIDGELFYYEGQVQVLLHALSSHSQSIHGRCGTPPPALISVVAWDEIPTDYERRQQPIRRCVQVWSADIERGFFGLGPMRSGRGSPWVGPVFELVERGVTTPAVGEGWRFDAPRLFVDNRSNELPLIRAEVHELEAPTLAVEGRVPMLVELELELERFPSTTNELIYLTQARGPRRLDIGGATGSGVRLAELGCLQALALGRPDEPVGPDDSLTIQLLLSSRPPQALAELRSLGPITAACFGRTLEQPKLLERVCKSVVEGIRELAIAPAAPTDDASLRELAGRVGKTRIYAREGHRVAAFATPVAEPELLAERLRAELDVRAVEILDPEILARRCDPDLPLTWLRRAIDGTRPDLDPLERRLIELLDERGAAEIPDEEWTVLADLLLARGDSLGADILADRPPSDGPSLALWEATRDHALRWRVGDHDWAPRVRGTWRGPLLTTLAVEPGWIRVGELPPPNRIRPVPSARWPARVGFQALQSVRVNPGPEPVTGGAAIEPRIPAIGELLDIDRWDDPPGFDARPEVFDMLRLPCCRLLSARRVVLAGHLPPSLDHLGDTLDGVDLRGLYLESPSMQRARLRGADLRKVRVVEGSFADADLRDADLRGAHLQWTELMRADLRGADLRNLALVHVGAARVAGADLRGAKIHADEIPAWRQLGCDPEQFEICARAGPPPPPSPR